MKTKQEYLKDLTKAIYRNKCMIEICSLIHPVIKKFDGKDIRQMKRFQKALNDVCPPGYSISFGEKYSWYELKVYHTVNGFNTNDIVSINCGYIGEVDTIDHDLILGLKERKTRGTLGNGPLFDGTLNQNLEKYEKQLENVETDYSEYCRLIKACEAFNVPFLNISIRP